MMLHHLVSLIPSLSLSFLFSIIVWEILSQNRNWNAAKAALRIEYLGTIPLVFLLPTTIVGTIINVFLGAFFIFVAFVAAKNVFTGEDDLIEVATTALKEFKVANSSQRAPVYALFFGYAVLDILLSFNIGVLAIPLVFLLADWGILFGYKVFSGENEFTSNFRLIRDGEPVSLFETSFLLFFSPPSKKVLKAIIAKLRGKYVTLEDDETILSWRRRN